MIKKPRSSTSPTQNASKKLTCRPRARAWPRAPRCRRWRSAACPCPRTAGSPPCGPTRAARGRCPGRLVVVGCVCLFACGWVFLIVCLERVGDWFGVLVKGTVDGGGDSTHIHRGYIDVAALQLFERHGNDNAERVSGKAAAFKRLSCCASGSSCPGEGTLREGVCPGLRCMTAFVWPAGPVQSRPSITYTQKHTTYSGLARACSSPHETTPV